MISKTLQRLLSVCVALLFQILDAAMDLSAADAGTLYLLEADGLHFSRMETRSLGVRQGGSAISLPPVPLDPAHICARAVLEGKLINVADVKQDDRFDFSGAKRYDALTGYDTHSMLVLPLTDDVGSIIGVLQLINALDAHGRITSFSPELEPLISALASQAAICLTNMHYSHQVGQLLDSLVRALSEAIDERTPYNANHSRSMARYAEKFLDYLDAAQHPWCIDRRAFLMSIRLHDVGKLTVPLAVMDKQTRLGALLKDVQHRFATMGLLNRIALLEGRLDSSAAREQAAALEAGLALVEKANTAAFLPEEQRRAIRQLGQNLYTDEAGTQCPWLTGQELECLCIPKGTLTAQERQIMEDHVVSTAKILEQVSFPDAYSQVPLWARAHHELLSGRGYPLGLSGDAIPKEVRLMTILDVFDALTAADRPYKAPMPAEKALSILENMAAEGSLDSEILALFRQSRAWE